MTANQLANNSLIKKSFKKQLNILLLAILCLSFFIVLDLLGWSVQIRMIVNVVLTPFKELGVSVSQLTARPWLMLRYSWHTVERIQDLQLRYAQAEAQLAELNFLKQENEQLKKLLLNSDTTNKKVSLATPILSLGKPAINLESSHIDQLDQLVGKAVFSQEVLLGFIHSIEGRQAYLDLLTLKESRPIIAITNSGVQGLVIGDGRRVLLTQVPRDQLLTIGESVVTVGQTGVGRGLFIGKIAEFLTKTSDPTQTAVIDQLVSFYELQVVQIK